MRSVSRFQPGASVPRFQPGASSVPLFQPGASVPLFQPGAYVQVANIKLDSKLILTSSVLRLINASVFCDDTLTEKPIRY